MSPRRSPMSLLALAVVLTTSSTVNSAPGAVHPEGTEWKIYPTGEVEVDTWRLQDAIDGAGPDDTILMKSFNDGAHYAAEFTARGPTPWVFGAELTRDFPIAPARHGVLVGASTTLYSQPWNAVTWNLGRESILRQGINVNKRLTIRGDTDPDLNPVTVCTTAPAFDWDYYAENFQTDPEKAYFGAYPIGTGWILQIDRVTVENLHFDHFSGIPLNAWHPFTARNVKVTSGGGGPIYTMFDNRIFYPEASSGRFTNSIPDDLRSLIENCTVGTPEGPTVSGIQGAMACGLTIRNCHVYCAPAFHPGIMLLPGTSWNRDANDQPVLDFAWDLVKDCIIENCDVKVQGNVGIALNAVWGAGVQNCVVRHNRVNADPGDPVAYIGIAGSARLGALSGCLVQDNTIGEAWSSGLDVTGLAALSPSGLPDSVRVQIEAFVRAGREGPAHVRDCSFVGNKMVGGLYGNGAVSLWGSVEGTLLLDNDYRDAALPGWPTGAGALLLFKATGACVSESLFPEGTDLCSQILVYSSTCAIPGFGACVDDSERVTRVQRMLSRARCEQEKHVGLPDAP